MYSKFQQKVPPTYAFLLNLRLLLLLSLLALARLVQLELLQLPLHVILDQSIKIILQFDFLSNSLLLLQVPSFLAGRTKLRSDVVAEVELLLLAEVLS